MPRGGPADPITDYTKAFPGEPSVRTAIPENLVVLSTGGRDNKWKYLLVDNASANDKALPYKVLPGYIELYVSGHTSWLGELLNSPISIRAPCRLTPGPVFGAKLDRCITQVFVEAVEDNVQISGELWILSYTSGDWVTGQRFSLCRAAKPSMLIISCTPHKSPLKVKSESLPRRRFSLRRSGSDGYHVG